MLAANWRNKVDLKNVLTHMAHGSVVTRFLAGQKKTRHQWTGWIRFGDSFIATKRPVIGRHERGCGM